MSINSNRKQPIGRRVVMTRIVNQALCEKAFSLIELLTVVIIIGVMLGGATIMWVVTERSTDAQSAAEMFKEDVRRVESMAGLGAGEGVDSIGIRQRDQYMLEINTSTAAADAPPNCYRIQTRTWGSSGYGNWTTVPPKGGEVNRIVLSKTSEKWIKPSDSSDMHIDILKLGSIDTSITNYQIIFESKGSMVQSQQSGDTTVRLGNSSKHADVTISIYGDISQ